MKKEAVGNLLTAFLFYTTRTTRVLSQAWRSFIMKLYHGTNIDFAEIDLKKSKLNIDFGQGFYLSADSKFLWNRTCNL